MVRGSIVIFSGFIRMWALKKPLKKHEWCGIGIVFVALIVVGCSYLFY